MSIAQLQDQRDRASDTLNVIEYFTGTGRAENAERYRKYFEKSDANGDRPIDRRLYIKVHAPPPGAFVRGTESAERACARRGFHSHRPDQQSPTSHMTMASACAATRGFSL